MIYVYSNFLSSSRTGSSFSNRRKGSKILIKTNPRPGVLTAHTLASNKVNLKPAVKPPQICTNRVLLLLYRNHIRDIPEMVVVVVIAGVRHITAVFGDDCVAGIHIKAGFGSAFQIDRGTDINR